MTIILCVRESKVTLLLKDALGGNCKTKALVTLHPSDTLGLASVLRTAGQLAQIQNYPIVNDFMAKVLYISDMFICLLIFWIQGLTPKLL